MELAAGSGGAGRSGSSPAPVADRAFCAMTGHASRTLILTESGAPAGLHMFPLFGISLLCFFPGALSFVVLMNE